jgi:2,3-diaminopropionate biosynthesis protein SbnB
MISNSRVVRLLGADDVAAATQGEETQIGRLIEQAYIAHSRGQTIVPHSCFLRLSPSNRIIALPAKVTIDNKDIAGFKWIASFPGNLLNNRPRASAVIVLNSTSDGRPRAVIEGSLISAHRTAASAAVAARVLGFSMGLLGVVGCGLIATHIVRYLSVLCPGKLSGIRAYDIRRDRAEAFLRQCGGLVSGEHSCATDVNSVLTECPLILFATTTGTPHVADVQLCRPGATILHISLRDLTPEFILRCRNIVDDEDHVMREKTSLALAYGMTKRAGLIESTIGRILAEKVSIRRSDSDIVAFSPFGLGILDIAVAQWALDQCDARGLGISVPDFLPAEWAEGAPSC